MPEVVVGAPADTHDSLPTASLSLRGHDAFIPQGEGVADIKAFCRKNASGEPEWVIAGDTFQVSLIAVPDQFTDLSAAGEAVGQAGVDLTDYAEVRIAALVLTAGTTGRLKLIYSVDDLTYPDLTTNFISLATPTGSKQSSWEPIPVGARGVVTIRTQAYNGDESEDPEVVAVVAHFRR